MIRVLLFIAVLFGLAWGFSWMADLPDTISISWNGYVWEQTPVVFTLMVGIFLTLFLMAVWIIRVIVKSPQIASRFFQRRRKDKGYAALSQGLLALGTGNAKLARRYGVDADRLLSQEPAAKLLLAQTAQLAGKDEEARERFEAMLDSPDTKALGLHGLFVEAERHKEPVAARHYAEEAAKTSPGLEWAGKAVLGYQAVAHHWDEALKTLERNYAGKLLDKKTYRRQRAVILTALAQKLETGEPERAYSLAKEAHGLALDLVPASVLTSRLATRRGDVRKAAKVLEATWRLFPHPDLAETYAHVRTGDSAVDRLKRVKSLAAQRANTPEGAMAIARAALEAREFDQARAHLKKVLQSNPTRQAFILMAEVEEAEHGDRGRMRDWLSRAVKAPLDKAWIADGIVLAEWQAVSPVTGKLEAFQWTTPVGLTGEGSEVLEDSLFDAPALPAAAAGVIDPSAADVHQPEPAKTLDVEAETVIDVSTAPQPDVTPAPVTQEKAPVQQTISGYEGTTDDVRSALAPKDLPDAPEGETAAPVVEASGTQAKSVEDTPPAADKPAEEKKPAQAESNPETSTKGASEDKAADTASAPAASKANKTSGKTEMNRPIEFPLSRMPDDPGTDEEEKEKLAKAPRPRFFN